MTEWKQSGYDPTEGYNSNVVWMEKVLLSNAFSQAAHSQFLKKAESPAGVCKWTKAFINLQGRDWDRIFLAHPNHNVDPKLPIFSLNFYKAFYSYKQTFVLYWKNTFAHVFLLQYKN